MRSDLDKLCEKLEIRIDCVYGGEMPEGFDPAGHPWKCYLRLGKRRMTVPFYQGSAHTKEPTAADVLSCLASDAIAGEQSFEDFCSDLGYDVDSRKAERTWKACQRTAPRLRRFLRDHFDAVSRAEH